MNHQLENKRALVTGGSRGIGAAIVRRLAREGAHVALTYVSNSNQAEETVKAARALGVKSLAIRADNADAEAVVAAVGETVREFQSMSMPLQAEWRHTLIEFYSTLPWAIRIDGGRAIVAHAAWHAELHEASDDRVRSYTLYGPTTGGRTPEGFPERIDWAPGYTVPELVVF